MIDYLGAIPAPKKIESTKARRKQTIDGYTVFILRGFLIKRLPTVES